MNQIIQKQEFKNILGTKVYEIFLELQTLIKEFNKNLNLTRLTDNSDYWISQVYDSIWPFITDSNRNFDNKKFLDIGSGCGFPGLGYAIIYPNSEVYLVDSSEKKTDALKKIIDELRLKNQIFIIKDRIENLGHNIKFRNKFDICTTRAVSSPPTVAEYMLPMLNRNGTGLLYCGKWLPEDELKLNKSLNILKGTIKERKKIHLPNNKGERNIIFIKPKEKCPDDFPRKNGKPKKYPLGN